MIVVAETTVPALREAKMLAKRAVSERLAACVQLEELISIYEWSGEMKEDKEYRVTFKTTRAKLAALEARVRELQSSDLLQWVTHEAAASKGYEEWVESVCR